jgi:hypothetical protein
MTARLTAWLMRRCGWAPLGFVHPETVRFGAPIHHDCKRADRVAVWGRA